MKNKIFDKMIEYGWSLEDFDDVYNLHYNFIDGVYTYMNDCYNAFHAVDMNKLNENKTWDMVCFMSDFLRAINDLDKGE